MLLNVNINILSDSKGLKGMMKKTVDTFWKYLVEYGHQVNQDLIALLKTFNQS